MPPTNTTALGIHQSDVIIRTAIIAAINDLRANPWLLDWAFASLPRDELTASTYGEAEVARAKEWFLNTNIPVFLNVARTDVKFPCITVGLQASAEVESEGTLGDTHYIPFEEDEHFGPVTLAGPFTPTSYDRATGTITLDKDDVGSFVIAPNMVVVTRTGSKYPILDVHDATTFVIEPGTITNLSDFVINSADPAYVAELESSLYREVYAIGAHVESEPVHLTYLHSILVFILLRYKESLLEARGFERSVISSQDLRVDSEMVPEFVYSRYCQVTGYVRQSWPKTIKQKVQLIRPEILASPHKVEDQTVDILTPGNVLARYYTTAPLSNLNEDFVTSWSAQLGTSRAFSGVVEADAGEYIWYAYPTQFNEGASANDFYDDMTGELIAFTFAGKVPIRGISYDVWRSTQAGLGAIVLRVAG